MEELPPTYTLLKAEAPDDMADIKVKHLSPAELPKFWRDDPTVTRTIGDQWLASREAALMRVPSAIVPETFNVLLNPEHADAPRVNVLSYSRYPWDLRLFRT